MALVSLMGLGFLESGRKPEKNMFKTELEIPESRQPLRNKECSDSEQEPRMCLQGGRVSCTQPAPQCRSEGCPGLSGEEVWNG